MAREHGARTLSARVVVLGDRRTVTLGAYLRAWRAVNAAPDAQVYRDSLTTWWPVTAVDIRAQYRAGLAERINRALPWYGRGRKWSDDWQRAADHDARAINSASRLRVYASQITPNDWRARFANVYARHDD
jgi:hypothetical protein